MLVRQAANVLELMEYFARRKRPATLAEISDDLGWPRSSTFNLVGTIADKGWLYEPRARNGYYPSPRWLMLARAVADAEPLPDAAHALVTEIADQTGETTGRRRPRRNISDLSGCRRVRAFGALLRPDRRPRSGPCEFGGARHSRAAFARRAQGDLSQDQVRSLLPTRHRQRQRRSRTNSERRPSAAISRVHRNISPTSRASPCPCRCNIAGCRWWLPARHRAA